MILQILVLGRVFHVYPWSYTYTMPTTRTRHFIIETDHLKQTLDEAATLWPELSEDRTALLRKVLEAGESWVREQVGAKKRIRIQSIETLIQDSENIWPSDWNEARKAEWPD